MRIEASNLNRYCLLLCGGFMIGIGIALCNKAGWGADPIVTLYEGVAKTLQVSIDVATLLVACVIFLFVLFLDIKQVGLGTILLMIVTPLGVRLGMQYLQVFDNKYANILFTVLGLTIIGINIAVTIVANVGKSCNDALMVALTHRYERPYHHFRWLLDGIFLVSGILLGGTITLGTILGVAFLGKLVSYTRHVLENHVLREV